MHKACTRHNVRRCLRRLVTLCAFILCLGAVSVAAQSAWLTMETDHFLIHFLQDRTNFAHDIARRAEAVHEWIVPIMGHAPATKTHIVIRDGEDVANALASPVYENRIEINSAYPTIPEAYLSGFSFGHDDWFTLLLIHEYAHIVQLDMKPDSARRILDTFGRVPLIVSPLLISPPFVLEGYAVYMESLGGGGRGNSTYYDMFLRTAALQNAIPEYDQVLGEYNLERWQPGGNIYLFGSSFLHYIAQEFGEDSLHRMNEQLKQHPTSLAQAVQSATDTSLPVLWERWRRALLDRAETQLQSLQSLPITEGNIVSTAGHHALMPAISPDGEHVAFVATGGVAPSIRLLQTSNDQERHLASVQSVLTSRIAWHPSGEHIVASALALQGDGSTQNRLARIHTETGAMQYVPETQRAHSPSYDRTGKRLTFIVHHDAGTELRMCVDECETTQLLFHDPNKTLLSAAWSPVQDVLALTVWESEYGAYIALYDVATKQFRSIAGGGGDFTMPSWSPDGRRLVFTSDRSGVFNVYVYDITSSSLTRVTNTVTGLFSPVFASENELLVMQYSADGYELAYISLNDEGIRIDEPAWLGSDDDGTVPMLPPVNLATGTYTVSDYIPWHTLRPTFWLPSIRERAGETHVGVMTAGEDVLGTVRYTVEASIGMGTGRTMYDLALEHDLGEGAWTAFFQGKKAVVPGEHAVDIWDDAITLHGGLRWYGAFPSGVQQAWVQRVQQTVQRKAIAGTSSVTDNRWEFGWRAEQHSGTLFTQVRRLYEASAVLTPGYNERWLASFAYDNTLRHAQDRYVRWRIDAGAGGEASMFALRAHQFSSRGFNNKSEEMFGHVVLHSTLEGRFRIADIKRGYVDTPLFLNDVAVYPFLQTRYVADIKNTGANDISFAYGAEIGLDMYMGYGALRNDWRIGIVKKQPAQSPEVYVRVASSF